MIEEQETHDVTVESVGRIVHDVGRIVHAALAFKAFTDGLLADAGLQRQPYRQVAELLLDSIRMCKQVENTADILHVLGTGTDYVHNVGSFL
jgi:hypothetical protein